MTTGDKKLRRNCTNLLSTIKYLYLNSHYFEPFIYNVLLSYLEIISKWKYRKIWKFCDTFLLSKNIFVPTSVRCEMSVLFLSSSSSAKWTTKASLLATSLIFFCLKPLPVSVSELTTGRCLPRHFVYFNCLGLWALRVISLYFSLSSKGRKMKLKITRRSTMLLRRTRVKNVGRLCVIRKFFHEWVVDLIWIGLRAPLHWTCS